MTYKTLDNWAMPVVFLSVCMIVGLDGWQTFAVLVAAFCWSLVAIYRGMENKQ